MSVKEHTAKEFINDGSGIVTLCGSTKFFFEAVEADRRLTFNNWIVLKCGSWGHSFHKYNVTPNTNYEAVKRLHFHKILESDCIVVITDDTYYVGKSTKAEIAFSEYRSIPVFYFNGKSFTGTTTKKPPNKFTDDSLLDEFVKKYGSLGF